MRNDDSHGDQVVHALDIQEYFRDALRHAIDRQDAEISELTEYYLVTLLVDFVKSERLFGTDDDGPGNQPLALMMSRAMCATPGRKIKLLQSIGDFSLYICGFFSDSLDRKIVDIDYYISMGSKAYYNLSHFFESIHQEEHSSDLFKGLALKFQLLVDLLCEISETSMFNTNKGILRLYDKWLRTQSERSKRLLIESGIIPNENLKKGVFH